MSKREQEVVQITDLNSLKSFMGDILQNYPEYKERKFTFDTSTTINKFKTFSLCRKFLSYAIFKLKQHSVEQTFSTFLLSNDLYIENYGQLLGIIENPELDLLSTYLDNIDPMIFGSALYEKAITDYVSKNGREINSILNMTLNIIPREVRYIPKGATGYGTSEIAAEVSAASEYGSGDVDVAFDED